MNEYRRTNTNTFTRTRAQYLKIGILFVGWVDDDDDILGIKLLISFLLQSLSFLQNSQTTFERKSDNKQQQRRLKIKGVQYFYTH